MWQKNKFESSECLSSDAGVPNKMSLRLKPVLPLLQCVIAVGLLISDQKQLEDAKGHRLYGSFGPPATRVCYAINGPVFLGRTLMSNLWSRTGDSYRVDVTMGDCLFLVLVAFLWYLVAIEIEAGGKQKGIRALPLRWRITVDSILALSGVFCGLLAVALWFGRNLRYVPLAQLSVRNNTLHDMGHNTDVEVHTGSGSLHRGVPTMSVRLLCILDWVLQEENGPAGFTRAAIEVAGDRGVLQCPK